MGKLVNGIWVDWIEKVKILQKVVIENEDGFFLALKRPKAEKVRPNFWDLCGGSVDIEDVDKWKNNSGIGDKNDILIRAISREINEETNFNTEKIKVIHIASGFNDKKGVFIVAIGYLAIIDNKKGLKLSEEHSDFKWVNKEEFLKLDFGDDGGLIKSILNQLS